MQITDASNRSLKSRSTSFRNRRRTARAFSRCKIKPRLWRRRFATLEFCSPVSTALVLASSLQTLCAAGPQPPPTASQITGMKVMPSARHFSSVSRYEHFSLSYASVAAELSSADLLTKSTLRPLVTAKSRAAGVPLRHLGMNMSAGLRF